MRPKFIIIILILATLMLVILSFIKPISERQKVMGQTEGNFKLNQSITDQKVSGSNEQTTTSIVSQLSQVTNRVSLQELTEKFVQDKNKPINFYGQVIDQDSNALSGANVRILIQQLIPLNPASGELMAAKKIVLEQSSDANGRFEFHGESGDGFGIQIEKKDYELEPNRYGFGSSAGSYGSPIIFKMWNTNIHGQLISKDKSFEVVPDGRPYFIDLTKGTISEQKAGDLKLWIQYTNQVVQGQFYNWSAGIEVVDGGLFEVTQEQINSGFLADPPFAMYVAPSAGYVSSFKHEGQIKGGQSGEIGNRYFYLLLKGGKEFGRMSINMFAPYGRLHPGFVQISYAVNPSGAKILKP